MPNKLLSQGLRLCKKIESLGGDAQALVVGGAVRDAILCREFDDIDIAHNLPMEFIKALTGAEGVGRGEEFGVTVVTFEGERFEVAHFREESGYSDGRRPDTVTNTNDFRSDAARRDFTINAMGMRSDGTIEDPWGGMADIQARLVRCVGCPMDRFAEDPVRMLRAGRFSAVLGFSLDDEIIAAAKGLAIRLRDVSPERTTKELLKAAGDGKVLAEFIGACDKMGLLPHFLPEVSAMKGFGHNPKHHPEGGVFEHTMAALRCSDTSVPEHNLGILLHDIGKPQTLELNDAGQPTYHGHEAAGANMIPDIAKRMKWPTALAATLQDVCSEHMKVHVLGDMGKPTRIHLRMHPNWAAIKAAAAADSRCRLDLHNEADFSSQMQKLDEETAAWGTKAELEKNLNAIASGHIIRDAVPEIADRDIGKVKKATWEWLVGRSLKVAPDEVHSFIRSAHKGISA